MCVCVLVVFVFVAASRRGTAPSVAFELRSSTEQRLCLCCHCCCCCCFGSGTGFGFGSWPRLQLHFGLDPSSNANVSMNLIVNTSMCVRHGTEQQSWTESSAARTPFFGTHAHAITYAVGHPPPLPFNCIFGGTQNSCCCCCCRSNSPLSRGKFVSELLCNFLTLIISLNSLILPHTENIHLQYIVCSHSIERSFIFYNV